MISSSPLRSSTSPVSAEQVSVPSSTNGAATIPEGTAATAIPSTTSVDLVAASVSSAPAQLTAADQGEWGDFVAFDGTFFPSHVDCSTL